MMADKKSAGVAPEVNLRNPLHASDKAHNRGFHSYFELCPSKIKKYKLELNTLLIALQCDISDSNWKELST